MNETTARPDTPEASDEVRDLKAAGWTETGRSRGVVRLRRDVPASEPDALALVVGDRPAAVLAGHGLGTLDAALDALDEDPDAVAALDGVGKATVAKLARAAELRAGETRTGEPDAIGA